jgi:hypothetical protein
MSKDTHEFAGLHVGRDEELRLVNGRSRIEHPFSKVALNESLDLHLVILIFVCTSKVAQLRESGIVRRFDATNGDLRRISHEARPAL